MYSSSGGFHIAHSTFEGDGVGSFSFQTELELKKRVSPGADQSRFGFVPPSSRSARVWIRGSGGGGVGVGVGC